MVPPSTELLPSAAPSSVHHFVATPHLGGNRAARGVAQQVDEDLAAATLAVAGVAAAGQLAVLAGVPDGGQVVQREAAVLQVAAGQPVEDADGGGAGADDGAAVEQQGDAVDQRLGELGEVGVGDLADLAVVPVGGAEQDGRGRVCGWGRARCTWVLLWHTEGNNVKHKRIGNSHL